MNTLTVKFTTENTSGYSEEQIAELNRRFDAAMLGVDPDGKNLADEIKNLADRVLSEYDSEQRI